MMTFSNNETQACDHVIVAVGTAPRTMDLGLEKVGIETD